MTLTVQATLSVEMATAVDAITGQMTAAESHDDCFQKRFSQDALLDASHISQFSP